MTKFTTGGMVGTRIYLSWAASIYANADSSLRLEGGTAGYDDAGEDACDPRDIMADKRSPPQKKIKIRAGGVCASLVPRRLPKLLRRKE